MWLRYTNPKNGVWNDSSALFFAGRVSILASAARIRRLEFRRRMANPHKEQVLDALRQRFGGVRKIKGSRSLFVVGDEAARVYFRYSKVHAGGRTFFGLRETDLRQLDGHNSFICFLVDIDSIPIFIPYADFEPVFRGAQPAKDGQFKAQLSTKGTRELYVARQGRFNVEGYVGFEMLERSVDSQLFRNAGTLNHSQVQTLLAGIGNMKGFDVWIPANDVRKLDWSLTKQFPLRDEIPRGFEEVANVLRGIDVVWVKRGRSMIEGLYEVEHSTAVYSGLLRFNDILLLDPKVSQYTIVSNETRRDLFSRQLFRPTFRRSGLSELCSFLEYGNVINWHKRLLQDGEL